MQTNYRHVLADVREINVGNFRGKARFSSSFEIRGLRDRAKADNAMSWFPLRVSSKISEFTDRFVSVLLSNLRSSTSLLTSYVVKLRLRLGFPC